ncbi:MAG: hypothetical protein ACKOWO_09610 [Sediminibacterium sp.]
MTTKTSIAAKAARRKAKVERKSADAIVSIYSSLKNLNMGQKNNSGFATKNPKDIKIGISYFMTFVKCASKIDYTTDLDRFTNTYNHVKNHPAGVIAFRSEMYKILMELVKSNAPVDEYFYTIGMHYLVSFDPVRNILESQPQTALGFMVEPKKNDVDGAMVFASDYSFWEYSVSNRGAA